MVYQLTIQFEDAPGVNGPEIANYLVSEAVDYLGEKYFIGAHFGVAPEEITCP